MAYGMWCEIKFATGQQFHAICIAQPSFHLKHCSIDGISMENLYKSSPIYVESRTLILFQTPALPPQQQNKLESKLECDKDMPKICSADTAKRWQRPLPCQPCRTGDNPF
jgi:hypothetical protein